MMSLCVGGLGGGEGGGYLYVPYRAVIFCEMFFMDGWGAKNDDIFPPSDMDILGTKS